MADVGHLAALLAPRPLVLSGAIEPEGGPATLERIRSAFDFTRRIYGLVGAAERLKLGEPATFERCVDRAEAELIGDLAVRSERS